MNPRRRVRTVATVTTCGLLLAAVAAAAAIASSTGASAAQSCAALANLQAFHGTATLDYDESAPGRTPATAATRRSASPAMPRAWS